MTDNGENSIFTPQAPYLRKYWLVCESLLVVLTVVAIYLAVRLMQHALDRKSNSKIGREIRQKAWLKRLCAASSLAFVMRIICNHMAAFWGWQSDELCFATVTASTVMFCLALYPMYIFLWVRQSIFYTNPVIQKGLNVWVTRISWLTLAFMAVTGLAMPFLYNIPEITGWEYRATEEGCIEVSEDSAEFAPGISVAFTILFQVVLLGLFVYPLLSKEMAKFRAPNASPNKSVHMMSSTLSKSDEGKRQDSEQEEDRDEAFYPTTSRPGSPLVRPISPLVLDGRQHFTFDKTTKLSETDNESTDIPEHIARNEQKTPRKVSQSTHQYTRAHMHSVSSDNPGSPALSDSELPKNKGNTLVGTIRRKFRPRDRQSKRNNEESRRRKGRKLVIMMKKYSQLMACCVITDAVTAGIQIAFVLPELVYLLLFDLNILINLSCIVLTYSEWQAIILPCTVDFEDNDSKNLTPKLRRRPTPIRRATRTDRVQELKREGNRNNSMSPSRSPSGSGYESGDSFTQIYRPVVDMQNRRSTSRL